MLEELEEYKGKNPTSSKEWVPFTLDELIEKIGDREYDEIRELSGSMGTELDFFRGETWLFTVIKYGNMYYVRKVNLPYEKYMTYITALRFPIATGIILAGWFWKYSFQKYGKLRALGIIFVPVFVWWLSGFLPILILSPSRIVNEIYLMALLTLYMGVIVPYLILSYPGLILGIIVLFSLGYLYKRYLYPRYEPETRADEYDFIEEKSRESYTII